MKNKRSIPSEKTLSKLFKGCYLEKHNTKEDHVEIVLWDSKYNKYITFNIVTPLTERTFAIVEYIYHKLPRFKL